MTVTASANSSTQPRSPSPIIQPIIALMPSIMEIGLRRLAIVLACVALLAACGDKPSPRPPDLASGEKIYAQHCSACHGAKLEGQPNWRQRLPNGRLPAPPHDESGHTWHHTDEVLFAIVKNGLVPPYAPRGYESDMPAFVGKLSDDQIRDVLAYIASHWSSREVIEMRAEMIRNASRRQ